MSENDFVPLSPQLGVAGSSYRLQMGQVNGYWAIRLAKGNDVLESKVFKDEENKEMPNANKITGWVLSVIAIPNINTFQIQKTVGFVRQKALEAFEDFKRKKESQGKSESGSVTLDKIPEGTQVKRPQGPGWVKEDKPVSEAEKSNTAESSPSSVSSNPTPPVKAAETVPSVESKSVSSPPASPAPNSTPSGNSSGKRALNPIPRGEGFSESPAPVSSAVEKKESPSGSDQKAKLQSDLEKRVAEIEKQMKKLQTELESVKSDLAKLK